MAPKLTKQVGKEISGIPVHTKRVRKKTANRFTNIPQDHELQWLCPCYGSQVARQDRDREIISRFSRILVPLADDNGFSP